MLIALLALSGWLWLAPAATLGAVGDLTFTGCIGGDAEMGCTPVAAPALLYGGGQKGVVVSPDGRSVYVTGFPGAEGPEAEGVVDEFARNASTGALTFAGCIGYTTVGSCTTTIPFNALGEPDSLAVSPDGGNVYATSYHYSDVAILSRNSETGTLTFDGCIGNTSGCSETKPKGALDTARSVAVSADGRSVYVGSENSLSVFERNASSGGLTYKGCFGEETGCTTTSPVDAVVGVSAVAVSPDGASVYANNEAFGAVDVFSRDASTGALTYGGCIGDESTSECATKLPHQPLDNAISLAVSADGGSVYAASRGFPGAGGISAFARSTSTGGLIYVGCYGEGEGCTAPNPANALQQDYGLAVSPDGGSVYAASEESNAVSIFARNPVTSVLTYASCIGNDSETGCTATNPADALDDANGVGVSPEGASVYATGGATVNEFSRETGSPVTPPNTPPSPPGSSPPASSPPASSPPTFSPPASLPPASPLPTLPLSPQTARATFDDQRIALTTPSPISCAAPGATLAVTLDSTAIARSRAARLRFSSAALYIDGGIRHRQTTGHSGHKKIVISYVPNGTARRVPTTLELSLSGLKPGVHTLTVKFFYKMTTHRHGRTVTVMATKTLTAKFEVC